MPGVRSVCTDEVHAAATSRGLGLGVWVSDDYFRTLPERVGCPAEDTPENCAWFARQVP